MTLHSFPETDILEAARLFRVFSEDGKLRAMPGHRESRFDAALDNATHAALAVLGLRAEDMVDTADGLNEEMEPVFRNWVDAAGEASIPDKVPVTPIAKTLADAITFEDLVSDAARVAVSAFGIDADWAPETTEEIADAIARILRPHLVPEEPDDLDDLNLGH